MTDNKQVNGSESLWFYERCTWCWCEVKNTEAIHVGDKTFCSKYCQNKDAANPEGAEA